jgi:outer membrane protein
MKNTSLLINVILSAAVVVLFILHFTSTSGSPGTSESNDTASSEVDTIIPMKFASINVDTLLNQYEYAKEMEDKLMKKQKGLEDELARKMAAFEKEATDFQKKVQANAFLSMESAQRQEQELYEKQQKLLKWKDDVSLQLAKESQQLELQLLDTVNQFIRDYNKSERYEIIFNSAAFLFGHQGLDITDTVVVLLNERYHKFKPAK